MYEILIIICLSGALFLLLRHYPRAKEEGMGLNLAKYRDFLSRFKLPKRLIRQKVEQIGIPVEEPKVFEAPEPIIKDDLSHLNPEVANLIREARESFSANDLRLAEEKSLEAIGKEKRCDQAYLMIGKIAFSRGQFQDAKEAFNASLKCKKESGECYYFLGQIDLRNDNLFPAVDNFCKAINYEKNHADWYAELGRAYMEIRQYSKAAKVLKRAASMDIDNADYKKLAAEAEEKQRFHSFYSRGK